MIGRRGDGASRGPGREGGGGGEMAVGSTAGGGGESGAALEEVELRPLVHRNVLKSGIRDLQSDLAKGGLQAAHRLMGAHSEYLLFA